MPAPPKFNAGSIAVFAMVTQNDADDMIRAIKRALDLDSMGRFMGSQMLPWLHQRAKARFGSEGDDASGMWAELRPATVAIRETLGFPGEHPINRRTGALENWITGGADAIITARRGGTDGEKDGVELFWPGRMPGGTLRDKFETAQRGRPNTRKKSPRTVPRPVVAVNQADMTFFMTAWSLWFSAEFLKARR